MNPLKKIDTMTDEQANTFFSFFIKIKVLEPIQTILHKLENCEYRDVDVKWLNHQMIKFSNIAMDIMGHKEHLIDTNEIVINGVINSYNYMMSFHIRLSKLPKTTRVEKTKKRIIYMNNIASAFGITLEKGFNGKFYFEKNTNEENNERVRI